MSKRFIIFTIMLSTCLVLTGCENSDQDAYFPDDIKSGENRDPFRSNPSKKGPYPRIFKEDKPPYTKYHLPTENKSGVDETPDNHT